MAGLRSLARSFAPYAMQINTAILLRAGVYIYIYMGMYVYTFEKGVSLLRERLLRGGGSLRVVFFFFFSIN